MSDKLHKIHFNNTRIILDIASGAVHIVDELIWDIVDLFEKNSLDEIVKKLNSKYDEKDIVEGYGEIKELVDEGLIFTTDDYLKDVKSMHSNIVKALCLHVAHDCNLRCEYCFASQGNFRGEAMLMPFEIGKKALDFLIKESGNRRNLEVDFFGGEPLMNFEVVKDLVKYGRSIEKEYNKNFRFTITTNGILLDDEKMKFINENMDNVVMSLDGRKLINDKMRHTASGAGSYDIIVPKFQKMVKLRGDKDYFVRGTFTSNNLDFTKDILEFYKLGFKKVSIEPVVTDPQKDYALREEHLPKILKEYELFSKEYVKIRNKDKKFKFFHFMIDLEQGPCIIKRISGCGAGSEYLAVTPNGDLYPCHQFVGEKQFKIGDVYQGITNLKLRDKFREQNVYSKEDCRKCWARFYCSGGCHANAYYANGDIKKPYKMGCEMEKKRIECAISAAAILARGESHDN